MGGRRSNPHLRHGAHGTGAGASLTDPYLHARIHSGNRGSTGPHFSSGDGGRTGNSGRGRRIDWCISFRGNRSRIGDGSDHRGRRLAIGSRRNMSARNLGKAGRARPEGAPTRQPGRDQPFRPVSSDLARSQRPSREARDAPVILMPSPRASASTRLKRRSKRELASRNAVSG